MSFYPIPGPIECFLMQFVKSLREWDLFHTVRCGVNYTAHLRGALSALAAKDLPVAQYSSYLALERANVAGLAETLRRSSFSFF